MDGPIGAADDLFSSLSSTPQDTSVSYSRNFYSSDDEDEDDYNNVTTTTETPTVFDRFFDSSSEDEFYSTGSGADKLVVQSAGKRLEYMIQYLDRKLDQNDNEVNLALPEFIASGGGCGIFKLPVRSAVDPHTPPSLQFRPNPLRETQIGRSLRVLEGAANGELLWGGSECGVRVWAIKDMYTAGRGEVDDQVPCYESITTSPTLCLVVDDANMLIWSGHKDGNIRCWNMSLSVDAYKVPFRVSISWQAHRGPVLSMAISSFGDLWSGSEGGSIVVWPCEAIEKALSLTMEERHLAALTVESSCIDLKEQVTMVGVSCSVLAADVKCMLCHLSEAKMWTMGYLSFALWDASTRELLKAFNIDGQIETLSIIQDLTSDPKKDKTQNPFNFFQRSRNAIMEAAESVRKAAIKGAFGDDNRRIEASIITPNGIIWTGSQNGLLLQWDKNGTRLRELQFYPYSITSLCTFGLQIWVGYGNGALVILDLDGNLIGKWVAHRSPIIDMSHGAGFIFTLSNDGGIRGWNISSPGELDSLLSLELGGKEFLYTKVEKLKILAGTWNVAQGRAANYSIVSWLGSECADVDMIVVGLQEVELGAAFLAMSAARETMQLGLEMSSNGKWWVGMLGKSFTKFQHVGSRQLSGLLVAVWVRNEMRGYVGDVDVAAVPCGFGHAIPNKGAVGLRMRVYGRIMCFVSCHFAAHQEAVNRRNADFDHVYRKMSFTPAATSVSSSIQMPRLPNVDGLPELSEADMVIFLGDFNYRLNDVSYDEARHLISRNKFESLKEKDQLRKEMKAGCVFQGMREAIITFPPTYKFERHQVGFEAYDSSEKKRVPAWCDRILYRDNRAASSFTCNLNCPVVASILQYEACMDVTDSDHKPVRCLFSVELARLDESMRRQEFGEIITSNDKIRLFLKQQQCYVPETILNTYNIILQDYDKSIFRITNQSEKDKALFRVICESRSSHSPRASFGFPQWLQVNPTIGIISPSQSVEILVGHNGTKTFNDGDPQNNNNWGEDKEIILIVEVRGSRSTQKTCHRVSLINKSKPMDQKSHIMWPADSSDAVDSLHGFYNPWKL